MLKCLHSPWSEHLSGKGIAELSEQAEFLTLHFNSSNSVGHCANLTFMPTPGHGLNRIGSLGLVPVGEGEKRACCIALKGRLYCMKLYVPKFISTSNPGTPPYLGIRSLLM